MNNIIKISIFLIVLGLISCNKIIPSGFWNNFQKNYIKVNKTDQGPWGGYRAMYWKSDTKKTFVSGNIISYAAKKGWILIDSLEINKNELDTWIHNETPIFPLSQTGFSTKIANDDVYLNFPRWINSDLKIYMFKTGWISYKSGTDESIDVNGFILINNEGNEMSVYHMIISNI